MNDTESELRFQPPFYSDDALKKEGLAATSLLRSLDLVEITTAERVNRALRSSLEAALQKIDELF